MNGTVVGTITDATGAAVRGAQVTITDVRTNTSRSTKTDGQGFYTFPNLPPATYEVKAQESGFSTAQRSGIALLVNSTERVDLSLQPGQVTETITVTGAPPILQTDTARTGATLSARQAAQLPLGTNRNFQNLINLVPGATRAEYHHSNFFNPQNSLNNQVNGQSSLGNNFQIEGVNDNERTGLLQVYVPPAAAIQQVDVTTSNYDPEQGAAVGAVVNVILKSGSNQFHGNAFEIWNGDRLNARNYFDYGANGQPFVKPRLVYN
ncbi:MAG: carboxypeptidase regulatory-like domain-containing protein [Bryobacteraceae bacterium]